jgi:hypothetical protein
VTRRPPHRSRRAVVSHRALQEDSRPPSGRYPGRGQPGLGSPHTPWSRDLKAREPLRVASPGVTAPLATPIAPRRPDPHGAADNLVEAGTVAADPGGVVVPTERGLEPRTQHPPTRLSGRLAPWGDALQRVPSRRPRGPAVERVVPRPRLPPATRAPQTLDAGLGSRWVPTQREHARLLRRPLQAEVSSPLASRRVDAFGVFRRLNCTPTIVCVSAQARLASTSSLDPRLAPPRSGIVPGPRREDRGDAPPVWGPRHRLEPLAVCVPHPGGAPLLDQPSPRVVLEARRQPPDPPLVLDVVEDAVEIRVHPPVVSPTWARARPGVPRVQRAQMWPLPLTTPPALRRVEGGAEARHRPLPQGIRDGRSPHRSQLALLVGASVPSDPCGAVALPLQSRPPWPDGLAQGLRVRCRPSAVPRGASHRGGEPDPSRGLWPSLRSPAGRWAWGRRSVLPGPCCRCRLRLPVRPCPRWTALPSSESSGWICRPRGRRRPCCAGVRLPARSGGRALHAV